MKSFIPFSRLLIFGIAALFLLAACERPTPRVDDIEVTEVPTADATAFPAVLPTIEVTATESAPSAEATTETSSENQATPEGGTASGTEATAVPGETPVALPENGIHVVQAGDTLFRLALIYGVTVDEIAAANGLTNVDTLEIGQEVKIPEPGTVTVEPTATVPATTAETTHIVQPGENLFRIGLQYGFTFTELAEYNGLADPNRIDVGQVIRIPPRP